MTSVAKQHDVFSSRHAGADVMLTVIGPLMLVINFSESSSALFATHKASADSNCDSGAEISVLY